jgi:PleD family two-component response regulator
MAKAERDGELDTLEEFLRRSDGALYEAKSGGRNRVVVR